jgi:hypothetical protein
MDLRMLVVRWEVGETGSEWCSMAEFDISDT